MAQDTDRRASELSRGVAEEIGVLLIRRRIKAFELAAKVGLSQSAMSRRMVGDHPFDLDEIARIAEVLGVGIVDLLPREQRGGRPTDGYAAPTVTGTYAHPDHPIVKKAATLRTPIIRATPAPTGEQRVTLR